MRVGRALLLLTPVLVAGCTTVREASVGWAHSQTTGHEAVAFRARYAKGAAPMLADFSVRGRVGAETQHAGISTGIYAAPWQDVRVHPRLAAGTHLIQLGRVDGDLAVGTASPWLELGLVWVVEEETTETPDSPWGMEAVPLAGDVPTLDRHEGLALTLGADVQYDLRLTRQGDELVWSVMIGVAWITRVEKSLPGIPPALGPP